MSQNDDSSEGFSVSRRNFLKSTGVASIAATVVGGREADAARRAKEPALTSNGRDGRSSPELQREGHFCPSLQARRIHGRRCYTMIRGYGTPVC